MRLIATFTLGVLVTCSLALLISGAPAASSDDCAPGIAPAGARAAAPGGPPAGAKAGPSGSKEPVKIPPKEPALTSPLLTGLVGEWACDCAYPTGGHAAGTAKAQLVMDGTALMTESELEWTSGDRTEKIQNLGLWKVAADGKTLSYYGFSSHDSAVDLLKGTLSDTEANVAGMTRWGPMRLRMSMEDGKLSQHLWIDHKDMGVIAFEKK